MKSIDALSRSQARQVAAALGLGNARLPLLLPGAARSSVPLAPEPTLEDVRDTVYLSAHVLSVPPSSSALVGTRMQSWRFRHDEGHRTIGSMLLMPQTCCWSRAHVFDLSSSSLYPPCCQLMRCDASCQLAQERVIANLAVISNFLAGRGSYKAAAAAPVEELAEDVPGLLQVNRRPCCIPYVMACSRINADDPTHVADISKDVFVIVNFPKLIIGAYAV